ncbi:MAG: hypothetical protein L3J11_05460, partial [Draconibacterium sp.]|nr:hypothetical protein [Draconibacterium sp.]
MKRSIIQLIIAGLFITANSVLAQQTPNYFFDNWKPKTFQIPEKTESIEFENGNANYSVSIFQDDT